MTERPTVAHAGLRSATPAANLVLLIGLVGIVLGSPSVVVRLGALGFVLLLAGWSGVPVGTFLRSLRFVIVFAVVLFIAQALSISHRRRTIPAATRGLDPDQIAWLKDHAGHLRRKPPFPRCTWVDQICATSARPAAGCSTGRLPVAVSVS